MACVFAVCLILGAAGAQASPQSKNLIRDGLATMQANDLLGALKLFNDAAAADREDGRALFYIGTVFNRLGRHGVALAAFQRMWNRKVTHRELGYEAGWAVLALGQHEMAAFLLEPYVNKNPKTAKALEFLGRALIPTTGSAERVARIIVGATIPVSSLMRSLAQATNWYASKADRTALRAPATTHFTDATRAGCLAATTANRWRRLGSTLRQRQRL